MGATEVGQAAGAKGTGEICFSAGFAARGVRPEAFCRSNA